jgi:cell division septal protein FtsQ
MPKKKNNLLPILLLILVLLAAGGLAYYFLIYLETDQVDLETTSVSLLKKVDNETIKELGELKACGNWPILTVSPDKDRGNPFSIKSREVVPVLSTITPECVPAKRK